MPALPSAGSGLFARDFPSARSSTLAAAVCASELQSVVRDLIGSASTAIEGTCNGMTSMRVGARGLSITKASLMEGRGESGALSRNEVENATTDLSLLS